MPPLETHPAGADVPGIGRRLRAHFRRKVATWLALAVGICAPYFALQQLRVLPLRGVPATPLDGWIGFDAAWIWPYVSIALLVPLAPLLAATREQLDRYAVGLSLLCATCFAVFLVAPVEGPRPAVAPDQPLYRWIVSVDRPSNSMPSLHAGLAVYSLLFVHRVLRPALGRRARHALALASVAWGGLILYATLATKQHWALDLPAGAAVAWAAHALAWRRPVRTTLRPPPSRTAPGDAAP